MENAGRRTAEAAELLLGSLPGRRVALVCGRGNNGGDGCVAARLLLSCGAVPRLILVGSPEDLSLDARQAWDAALAAGVEFTICAAAPTLAAAGASLSGAELIVDALLGTGFTPPARALAAVAINLINASGRPVLAVDIPSGLCADHGRISGAAVRATATVTFGYPKPGLVLHPGTQHSGRLWLANIGFPPDTDSLVAGELNLTTARDLAPYLLPRAPESHKGTYGHVLLVAGSRGLAGAATLAARGALRAGAGLVTAAVPASLAAVCLPGLPEAMLLALPDEAPAAPGTDAAAVVLGHLSRVSVLAIGPGLSRSAGSARLVRELCAATDLPLVLDADALHALAAAGPQATNKRRLPAVLTPHPGELARLLAMSTAGVQADRVEAARACAGRFRSVVVLKGARTVIALPGGTVWVNPTGNPGMAAAGMGDVLTGVIAAQLARGMEPHEAAVLGVYLHGLAGDLAVAATGPWGILASEVADRVPAAARYLMSNRDVSPNAHLTLLVA